MEFNTLRARLGRVACIALLGAGCASPDGSNRSLWSRLNPLPRGSQVAETPRAAEIKDPASLHLAYGLWREQVGDAEDAQVSYETVLREDPKNVDALVGLARLDQLAGRYEEAERRLAKALRQAPGNARVLAAQGQLYAAQNRWPDAIDQLNAAVLAAPKAAEHRYQLAVAIARSGDADAALPHFARTVGPAEAHYNIAYILHEQGRTREAERHLVEAVRQRPDLHVAQSMLDELRGGRTRLTAPAAVADASARQPNSAAAEARIAQTAMASERPAGGRGATPPITPAERSRFAVNPFAPSAPDSRPVGLAGRAGVSHGAASNAWYPTPADRQPEPVDGLTAAQREQMLNQRLVDGSALGDGPVRR